MMRKQIPEPSAAAAALAALNSATDGWRAQLMSAQQRVVALEQSGVEPVDPADAGGYDLNEAALLRLNGAAYSVVPGGSKPGIELFLTRREVAELKRTIDLASKQASEAMIDVGRALLKIHDSEIRALHRRRALVLLELFKINGELEELRLKLLRAGSSVAHPMDGWTLRLFGLSSPPSVLNSWPLKYVQLCLQEKIISQKDLEQ
jgi:hypothetical protein